MPLSAAIPTSISAPTPATARPSAPLALSLVSHGHAALVQALLLALARQCAGTLARVVLTLNLPEPPPAAPPQGWPFVLDIRRNERPMGFGTNHNRALANLSEPFVGLLNPDVALHNGDALAALVATAAAAGVGCAYPQQVDGTGRVQDSERQWPTPWALWRRRMQKKTEIQTDWVNAACLVLPRRAWEAVGGFDEAFFMYCEDVDLCARLRLAGFTLVRAPVQVVHAGARDSHRAWRPLVWHVRSLLQLWSRASFWRAQHLPALHALPQPPQIPAP